MLVGAGKSADTEDEEVSGFFGDDEENVGEDEDEDEDEDLQKDEDAY